MKKQLLAAVAALLLSAPVFAGTYSAAEIKKMFQQSVDTEDMRLRVQLRMQIAESSPDSAYGLASRAFLLDRAGRISPKDEIGLYTKALQLDPAMAVAYFNRAFAYSKLGDNDKAIEDYKNAEKTGIKRSLLYARLGDFYNDLGKKDLAMENYTKAIAAEPGHAFAHNNRGGLYLRRGEYDKAIADFTAALKTSTFAMAYMNRGDAYAGKKDYAAAFEDYKKAQALIPDGPDVYLRRGMLYFGIKEYKKAITDLEDAIRLAPKNTLALNYLGVSCYYSGDYSRAEDAFKRSSAADPKGLYAQEHLADVYEAMKQPGLAAEALAKAIELAPQRADLKEKLARLKSCGSSSPASAAPSADLYLSKAEARLADKNYKDAEAYLKQALKKKPDCPDAMVDLSLVMLRTNRRSEAVELFSSVMDTDPAQKRALKELSAYGVMDGTAPSANKLAILREMLKLYESAGE